MEHEDETHPTTATVRGHTRTIRERPIRFVCQECGSEVTEYRRPGPTPHYCNPCWPSVQATKSAERVRRYRERHRSNNQA